LVKKWNVGLIFRVSNICYLDYYVYNYPDEDQRPEKSEKAEKIISPVLLKSVSDQHRSRKELKMAKRTNKKESKNTDSPEATQREIKIGGTILRLAEATFVKNEKLFDNENQYIKYEGKIKNN